MDKRIPWAEYFMNIAYLVAERSTCLRRRVGALAVKDKRILAITFIFARCLFRFYSFFRAPRFQFTRARRGSFRAL